MLKRALSDMIRATVCFLVSLLYHCDVIFLPSFVLSERCDSKETRSTISRASVRAAVECVKLDGAAAADGAPVTPSDILEPAFSPVHIQIAWECLDL